MPTNINDPDEIIRAVGRQEEQTLPLRDRMEGDYRLYRLEPFQEVDGYGQPVEGFRSYTSNAPQVYADKVIQWTARAEFGIRIPQAGRTRAQRAADALKEKWTWGLMRSVDRRIQQRMEPPMRDLTAFHNVEWGMVVGRWLMMNTASGETVVDITPWDPMHTYWSVGAEGLDWVCYKVRKTRGRFAPSTAWTLERTSTHSGWERRTAMRRNLRCWTSTTGSSEIERPASCRERVCEWNNSTASPVPASCATAQGLPSTAEPTTTHGT